MAALLTATFKRYVTREQSLALIQAQFAADPRCPPVDLDWPRARCRRHEVLREDGPYDDHATLRTVVEWWVPILDTPKDELHVTFHDLTWRDPNGYGDTAPALKLDLGPSLNACCACARGNALKGAPCACHCHPPGSDAQRAFWVAWMSDPFWWKLGMSGTPALCGIALSLDAAAEEVARDPDAHNRRVYREVSEAVASLGDPSEVFAKVIEFAVHDGFNEGLREALATPALAECFRCGHAVFQEADIGEKCCTAACDGTYLRRES